MLTDEQIKYRDAQRDSIRVTINNHLESLKGTSGLKDETIEHMKKINNESNRT